MIWHSCCNAKFDGRLCERKLWIGSASGNRDDQYFRLDVKFFQAYAVSQVIASVGATIAWSSLTRTV